MVILTPQDLQSGAKVFLLELPACQKLQRLKFIVKHLL